MSDRSKLLALADAVEKLTGPDRRLDCLIENELGLARFVEDRPAPFGGGWLDKRVEPKPFTASFDAGMTLVPEGFNDWSIEGEGGQWVADFSLFNNEKNEDKWHLYVRANTPALALCAAALRAQAEALS